MYFAYFSLQKKVYTIQYWIIELKDLRGLYIILVLWLKKVNKLVHIFLLSWMINELDRLNVNLWYSTSRYNLEALALTYKFLSAMNNLDLLALALKYIYMRQLFSFYGSYLDSIHICRDSFLWPSPRRTPNTWRPRIASSSIRPCRGTSL